MSDHLSVGKYEYKIFDNALWIKVYYQDVDLGNYSEINEALSCNEPGKYSILREAKHIEHYYKGVYEFLLEYPELTGYNRWKQSNYPLDTTESVSGFVNVSCSWTDNCWRGLSRTNRPCALLDGTGGNCGWYYAFGMKINCDPVYTHTFPGPTGYRSKVYLWMRVSTTKRGYHCTCKSSNSRQKLLFYVSLLVMT